MTMPEYAGQYDALAKAQELEQKLSDLQEQVFRMVDAIAVLENRIVDLETA